MAGSRKRHSRRRSGGSAFGWRTLRLAGIICFLAIAIVAVTAALMQTSAITFGQKTTANSTCAKLTTTVVDTSNPGETTVLAKVLSSSSTNVMAAVDCTPMFQEASVGNDLIARAMQQGHLAAPVFIRAYRENVGLADIWMVPVVDKNNLPLALLAFDYDASTQQLRAGEFAAVTGDMFYVTHAFPYLSSGLAISDLAAQNHIILAPSGAAQLIYFPGDTDGLTDGTQQWQGGGTSIFDPIWRVPGADGQWHYVDHNGHVHLSTDLHVETDYPAMPANSATQ